MLVVDPYGRLPGPKNTGRDRRIPQHRAAPDGGRAYAAAAWPAMTGCTSTTAVI